MTLRSVSSPAYIPGKNDDDLENRVLPRILLRQAERFGSKPFIDVCGRSASFEDMLQVSSQLARGLRQLGVNRSDRVAMLLPNCFELVALWFATSSLGAIEVPTNPGLKGDLLCHNLNNCGAEVLVADASALAELAKVQDSLPSLRTLILVGTAPAEARAAGIRIGRIVSFEECMAPQLGFDLVDVHYSDPMAILYTSGTTGPAKGALMSHHHCYAWAAAMASNLGYTSSDSYFSALPLFHTDAQMFGVLLPLIYGTKTTLVESFSASRFSGSGPRQRRNRDQSARCDGRHPDACSGIGQRPQSRQGVPVHSDGA
ncbi:AMP-binding protein (plasmid) [Aminobacter sp. UC22_36]|uniref:AMP-binding protein n=1 Tax=Aminobacter sp. UC22_36 TaxID=3374549 RepID=UPI003757E779